MDKEKVASESTEITVGATEQAIVEILVRLASLENLMVEKGLITAEELTQGITKYADALSLFMEQKFNMDKS